MLSLLLLPLHRARLLLLLVVVAVAPAALLPWLRRSLLPLRLQLQLWLMWGTGDALPCKQVGWGPCSWTACWVVGALGHRRQQPLQTVQPALISAPHVRSSSRGHLQHQLQHQQQQQQQAPILMLVV